MTNNRIQCSGTGKVHDFSEFRNNSNLKVSKRFLIPIYAKFFLKVISSPITLLIENLENISGIW